MDKESFKGFRVLVAEDDPIQIEVLSNLVVGLGAECDTAADGSAALAKLLDSEPGHYDLLLTDVNMPGLSGHEVTKRFRGADRPDAQTLPIVGVTADEDPAVFQTAIESGMNSITMKPVSKSVATAFFTLFLRERRTSAVFAARLQQTANEQRQMIAAEKFKSEITSFIVEHPAIDEVLDFAARRMIAAVRCQHVMVHMRDGRRLDWYPDDRSRYCMQCAECPLKCANAEVFGDGNELVERDLHASGSFRMSDCCPAKSMLARQIFVNERVWGKLAILFVADTQAITGICERLLQVTCDIMSLALQRVERDRMIERQAETLRKERDRAIAAERAKSYFFSTVSHDIRTPLNAIIGFSQMLKLGYKDKAEQDAAVESIIVSGKTLLQLVNDVLDLSKLEAGRMTIEPVPTDCRKLVNEIVESFRVANRKPGVEIRSEIGDLPPALSVDPQRIRQIVFNLVGNSTKFTDQGSIAVRLSFERTGEDSGTLRLAVADTGCGISEEDQLRIAQPYVQVAGTQGRHGGTGLGLAICRQLVAAMKGEIELESALGAGTTFYVSIPDVKVTDARMRSAKLSVTQRLSFMGGDTVPLAKLRVLAVDDSNVNLMVLRSMLTRLGVKEIVTAVNGVDALQKLRAAKFDVVLTDMWMPEMDGSGLMRSIRADKSLAQIPVYAVTADVEAQKTHEEQGFTGMLLKPVTLEKLREILV